MKKVLVKKALMILIVILLTGIPLVSVPVYALDGEAFLNKTLSVGSSVGTAYALTSSLKHNEGAFRPYAKGELRFLSGMEVLSKKGSIGAAIDITDTITGNIGYELEMFPDSTKKTSTSVGTDIALGQGFTGRIGYNLKEYPDSTNEKLYSFGIGYKFKL